MKFLILYPNHGDWPGEGMNYHSFYQALSKIADVKMAGEGYSLHRPNETIDQTVKRLYGDDLPDWVIERDDRFHIPKPQGRDYKVGVFISDLHGKHEYKIKDPESFVELINHANYQGVFYRYNLIEGTKYRSDIHKHIRAPTYWVPWSVDTETFYKRPGTTIDVSFVGATYRDVYPMREDILENLKDVAIGYTVISELRPPYRVPISELIKKKYFVGERYAQLLGQSRIFIFDCSKYRYPLQKFFEAMASGCLVMSNKPTEAHSLGFVDGKTYVEIKPENWRKRLRHYLENKDEAQAIAKAGMNITRKFHSHETRAKQFIEILSKD